MKVSLNWLNEYVKLPSSPDEVANHITLAGLEVEEVVQIGSSLQGVVVGEVLTRIQHPNADRLSVCSVDIGADEPVQIVCGAPNVAAGQKVLVATVGTTLPITLPDGSPLVINASKIRGERSQGMICAEDELGLGTDHAGILVLKTDKPNGTPIGEVMKLDIDHMLEVAITPNRPDATCHLGIARDLSAVLNEHLEKPYGKDEPTFAPLTASTIDVTIETPEKCHRYVGVMIRNVKVGPSPDWLKKRLTTIGLRSINSIVDATNFVMHELGQPLHAFDYEKIDGKRIVVRDYDHTTTFTTLDGQERSIPAGSLYICDGAKPVALAGIMGGMNSEISDTTTTVFLESAYFAPTGIRKTSKSIALQSDSSYRFERGIDPNITAHAAQRCADLILKLSEGAEIVGGVDIHPVKTEPITIALRLSFVNRTLGTTLRFNQIVSILKGLEFDVRKEAEEILMVTVPTFRPDISREIDLVEEVARIFNYNEIPNPGKIQFSRPYPLPYRETALKTIREAAVRLGFRETYGNSLLPEAQAELFASSDSLIHALNPISRDTTTMRPVLAPGFLRAAAFNFNRGAKSLRFFEIGNIFLKSENGTYVPGVHEDTHLLLGMGGISSDAHWMQPEKKFQLIELKGVMANLFTILGVSDQISTDTQPESITYRIGNVDLGTLRIPNPSINKMFDLNQPVAYAEVSLGVLLPAMERAFRITYQPIPKYPSIEYDIAVVVGQATASGDLENTIRKQAGKTLRSVTVFDVYEGKNLPQGTKSLGYRLVFRDDNRTLTIGDVDAIIRRVVTALDTSFGAKLRS
ncbi:MAG: hypothetical protein RL177_1088 [Bacteroidota bacterium]